MIENEEGRWIPIMEATEQAGVSRRTIYNWLKAGKLRFRRVASGSLRILEASLWSSYTGKRDAWIPDPRYLTQKQRAQELGIAGRHRRP